MSPIAGLTHDLTLEAADGSNKLGFMFPRDKTGLRGSRVYDYPTIAPRVLTADEISQAEFPPEIELVWKQENWQAGMGLVNHRIGLGQYGIAAGYKLDTTSPGGIIQLARQLIATTVDSVPNNYRSTGFAMVGSKVWAFVGQDAYFWDYTNKNWDIGTEPYAAARITKNGIPLGANVYAPRWTTADYPNGYIYKADADANWIDSTLNVWFKYMVKVNNQIWGLYEAVFSNAGTFYGNTSKTLGLGEGATTVYFNGDTTATYVNGDIILLERSTPSKEEFIQLTSNGVFEVGQNSTGPYTCTRGLFGTADVAHAGGEDSNEYTVAPTNARSTTNPTNAGSWAAASTVGTLNAEMTAGVPYNDGTNELLLVCKTDGLWTLNDAGTQTQLYAMQTEQHINHFRGAFSWDANRRVILPLGISGMFELYADVVRDISFSKTLPNQPWLHGKVVGGSAGTRFVFLLVQEVATTKYHLMMGELVEIGGVTDYRWHHVAAITYTTGTTPTQCAVMAEGVPSGNNVHHRVLVGISSSGSNLLPYFYPLSTDAEDRYSGDDDGYFITVLDDRGLPNVNKRETGIYFTTANLGPLATDNYIEIKYRVDGGAWAYITGVQATSKLTTSPQVLAFAAGVAGKTLELQGFLFQGTNLATSPQILDFTVKSALRTESVKAIPVAIYLADNLPGLDGADSGCRPRLDLDQLRTWNAQPQEVVARDAHGDSYVALFAPGTLKEREVAHEYGRNPEYIVTFLLLEVAQLPITVAEAVVGPALGFLTVAQAVVAFTASSSWAQSGPGVLVCDEVADDVQVQAALDA